MNKNKLVLGALIAIAGGVTFKTIQIIKNRKKEEVIEIEVQDENRD